MMEELKIGLGSLWLWVETGLLWEPILMIPVGMIVEQHMFSVAIKVVQGNGGQIKKLLPSDGEASDFFGISVAVSGDTIVVGAWNEDTCGKDCGAAYVFD